ncbi:hypothetical protein [Streptomyces sp. NPDC002540]
MRMRRALVSLALGGALALGGTAVTAQAADGTASPQLSAGETNAVLASSWHFYRAYWTLDACAAEGNALGGTFKCSYGIGNDGKYKWFLYRWY